MVFTPSFMGSEPCDIEEGPPAGVHLFRPEHDAGLAFMRSLTDTQLREAVFSPSISPVEVGHFGGKLYQREQPPAVA